MVDEGHCKGRWEHNWIEALEDIRAFAATENDVTVMVGASNDDLVGERGAEKTADAASSLAAVVVAVVGDFENNAQPPQPAME
jgi:putative aminopeptidase FrvX